MILENQNLSKKSKNISITVILYVIASVISIIGIALLVDNIFLFKNTINEYATKKIPMATVIKQLVLVKLLPGIFEPIGMYGGIASILFGIGMLNKKISKYLVLSTKTYTCNEKIEENTLEQNLDKQV